jgi:hypothetical protein
MKIASIIKLKFVQSFSQAFALKRGSAYFLEYADNAFRWLFCRRFVQTVVLEKYISLEGSK